MKKYTIPLIVAGVFGLAAGGIVWKLPSYVHIAFIVSAVVAGFFIAKNNSKQAVDEITK